MIKKTNCPVCRSKEIKFIFNGYDILYRTTNKIFQIYKCFECKAEFINPMPRFEELSNYYPKNYYSYEGKTGESFFERVKTNIVKKAFERKQLGIKDNLLVLLFKGKFSGLPLYRKKDGAFLDIGCGSGKNLKILKKYGWDTYGIELDEDAVKYAQSQGLKVQKANLQSVKFNRKFDLIRIWHVFEHLNNPIESIKKIASLLENDGEIMMAMPNTRSLARIIFRNNWYGLDVPRHVVNYRPSILYKLFESNGLECVEIKYSSCGSFVGSISNFLRKKFNYKNNLINIFLISLIFYPLDFISDLLKLGDTIFLVVRKK